MTHHRHFILNKPYGYLSLFVYNQTGRKKTKLLGAFYDFPDKTMAIGRLDEKSEGLLFLTTDGKVSEQVRSKLVEKEYYVQVDGLITDEAIESLQTGVEISLDGEKYTTLPGIALRLEPKPNFPERSRRVRDDRHGPTSWLSITITEGKFRQVRKMTSAVGFPTLRLVRVRIGAVILGDLSDGEVREVEVLTI